MKSTSKRTNTSGEKAAKKRAAADLAWLDSYNIVWDSQSTNATGSMPLAGGNLGLNVWVENNDVLFYIGHPDSRIEDGKLVKLTFYQLNYARLMSLDEPLTPVIPLSSIPICVSICAGINLVTTDASGHAWQRDFPLFISCLIPLL